MPLPQEANIQAFWQFEEASGDFVDQMGSYDLTAGNAPTYGATGIVGDCGDYNGTSDYMLHDNCDLFNAWEALTVMMWFQTPASMPGADNAFLMRLEANNFQYAIGIFVDCQDDKLYTRTRTSNETHGLVSDDALGVNTWYCIITRYERNVADSINNILNDVDQAETASPGDYATDATGNEAITIGARDNPDEYWDGLIDEIVIWDVYLSDSDCTDLYASGSPTRSLYSLSSGGTNEQLNISDAWKAIPAKQINIGDAWKDVAGEQINIGDAWKELF